MALNQFPVPAQSGTPVEVEQHIPAANVTRTQNGSVASFSTPISQAITVAAGQIVRIDACLDWSQATALADVSFVVFRDATELRRVKITTPAIGYKVLTTISFYDLTPGTGSITYEIKTLATSSVTTVYSDGTANATSSLSLMAIGAA